MILKAISSFKLKTKFISAVSNKKWFPFIAFKQRESSIFILQNKDENWSACMVDLGLATEDPQI